MVDETSAGMKGKAAIVTGGTRGVGRAIAERLATLGMDVCVAARSAEQVQAAEQQLAALGGGRALGIACDIVRNDDCVRLVDTAASTFRRLDVLVNNAGIGRFAPAGELEPETWDAVIATNLSGAFYCSRAAIPHLKRAGGGWILNIGSLAGKNPFARGAAYNASKFGLLGFSEAMMLDVRHDGIRVSCIMPGSVATGFEHPTGGGDSWRIQPGDIAQIVVDLLNTPGRTLPSRIEVRPTRPPRG